MKGQTNTYISKTKEEKLGITLKTNQLDHSPIIGVKIIITYATIIEEYIWEGKEIIIEVPQYVEYTISFSDIENYKTPVPVTYIAIPDYSRSLSFTYIPSQLKINILSNQGSSDSGILDIKATVKYGTTSIDVNNGETILIPIGKEITIIFPEINGYIKPDDIKFTNTEGGLIEKSGTYQTQLLTVNIVGETELPTNFTIICEDMRDGSIIFSQTTFLETHRIPYGIEYVIRAHFQGGFTENAEQTFIANSLTKTVTITFISDPGLTNPEDGIYIKCTNGKFYTESSWEPKYVPSCIAVIVGTIRFGIALEDTTSASYWGEEGNISGLTITTDKWTAAADYDGYNNTQRIISTAYDNPIARYCYDYIFPDGSRGYLGAAGEWYVSLYNAGKIKSLLSMIGKNWVDISAEYFTSTLQTVSSVWTALTSGVDLGAKGIGNYPYGIKNRAFCLI